MQDPQVQLKELGITLPDALDPSKTAVLDVEHRSFVGYETYFFADEADKRRFEADPTGSCGILTDPVTKQRFRPGSDSPQTAYNGRTYYFFEAASLETFEKAPDAFAKPNYDKIEIPGMPMTMPGPEPSLR